MRFSEIEFRCKCGEKNDILGMLMDGTVDSECTTEQVRWNSTSPWIVVDCECAGCERPYNIEYNPREGRVEVYDDCSDIVLSAVWSEEESE